MKTPSINGRHQVSDSRSTWLRYVICTIIADVGGIIVSMFTLLQLLDATAFVDMCEIDMLSYNQTTIISVNEIQL